MSLSVLISILRDLLVQLFKDRSDASKWGGWIEYTDHEDKHQKIELAGKIKSASVEVSGVRLAAEIEGEEHVLELRPGLHHAEVYVDGVHDADARAVVKPKGTAAHPVRAGIDIRPVVLPSGIEVRINLRFPA